MRIVSLCPSTTESLVALGAGGALAGVTRYCVHPREALRGVPRVGGTKDPDVDRILGLAPDLVFANAEENRREDVERLAARVPVDVSHPRRVAEVPALLRHFGERTGTSAAAEAWAGRIERALARLPRDPAPFRYVYLIWKDPYMTVGDRTYVADLLRQAGGLNAFGPSPSDYPRLSLDELAASGAGLVLLPDEPYRFREADREAIRRVLPGAEVQLVPGDDFCWHGVRTLRGLEALREISAAPAGPGAFR